MEILNRNLLYMSIRMIISRLRVIVTLSICNKANCKKFSQERIYFENRTNYCGGNRFLPFVRFNARSNGCGIINALLSNDLKNEIEISLCPRGKSLHFSSLRADFRCFFDTGAKTRAA